MLLPCDGVSTLQTISWFQELPGLKYKGFLKLPMNSAVKGTIDGLPMVSTDLAKQAVFLEAAKRMYDAGILDEKLVPFRPKFPARIEAFFNRLLPTYDNDKEDGEIPDIEMKPEWFTKQKPEVLFGRSRTIMVGQNYRVVRICIRQTNITETYKWPNIYKLQESNFGFGLISNTEIPHVGDFPLFGEFGCLTVSFKKCKSLEIQMTERYLNVLIKFQDTLFTDILAMKHPLIKDINVQDHTLLLIPLFKANDAWKIHDDILGLNGDSDGLSALFSCQNLRPPPSHSRRQSYGSRPPPPKVSKPTVNYGMKYKDVIVVPWYKRPKPLYFVDSVANEMSPLSPFYDGEYASYKDFYKKQCKTDVLNDNQPLLKCKLSRIGLQNQQLNYLLKKFTKEDEFPVYLVPELCYILPIPSSFVVQCKLIPSILHRLSRLLLAQELIQEVGILFGWKGALVNINDRESTSKEIGALNLLHEVQSNAEEERRKMRMDVRNRIKPKNKPFLEAQNIENRELHYEFIHPNKITAKDVALFHEAVSIQHAAKKLSIDNDVDIDIINAELSSPFKIDLIPIEDIQLPKIDRLFDLEKTPGPSHLSVMEALSLRKANEGLSSNRYKMIGMAFLNYAVSAYCFMNFPQWNEPLMCQLRNKLLSLAHLCALAKKKNIAERLTGSDFHPNLTWLPPGKKLLDGLGEIAAAEKVHLEVYDKILKDINRMTHDDIVRHVSTNAPLVLASTPVKSTLVKNKPTIKFTTFTHAEVSNISLASGVNALVGAFFTQCGPSGAFKFLQWMDFKAPSLNEDVEGEYLNFHKAKDSDTNFFSGEASNELMAIQRLLPGLDMFESLLGYTFQDKKNILEAFTHPSYPANDITDCYQRLEFLGDSLLDLLITNHVYTLPDQKITDVQLADICSALVNNITYASLAVRYDFHKHLLSMSQALTDMIDNFIVYQGAAEHQVIGYFTLISDEECLGPKHVEVPKVLGDIFEAVAGAIYIDSGKSLDTVWKVYYRLMQNEIDNFFEVMPKSPIHELKEKIGDVLELTRWTSKKLQSRGREMCRISVGPHGHYYGCGTNISRAKFSASKIALKMIKEEDAFVKDRDASKIMLLM